MAVKLCGIFIFRISPVRQSFIVNWQQNKTRGGERDDHDAHTYIWTVSAKHGLAHQKINSLCAAGVVGEFLEIKT